MMTIVTEIELKPGAADQWDRVMCERLDTARQRPGWVGGQVLKREDGDQHRVIVGTWRSRADWEQWHHDPEFAETRRVLDGLTRSEAAPRWHGVVADVRPHGDSKA